MYIDGMVLYIIKYDSPETRMNFMIEFNRDLLEQFFNLNLTHSHWCVAAVNLKIIDSI